MNPRCPHCGHEMPSGYMPELPADVVATVGPALASEAMGSSRRAEVVTARRTLVYGLRSLGWSSGTIARAMRLDRSGVCRMLRGG